MSWDVEVGCVLNRLQHLVGPLKSTFLNFAVHDNEEKEFNGEKEKQPVSQKDSGRERR